MHSCNKVQKTHTPSLSWQGYPHFVSVDPWSCRPLVVSTPDPADEWPTSSLGASDESMTGPRPQSVPTPIRARDAPMAACRCDFMPSTKAAGPAGPLCRLRDAAMLPCCCSDAIMPSTRPTPPPTPVVYRSEALTDPSPTDDAHQNPTSTTASCPIPGAVCRGPHCMGTGLQHRPCPSPHITFFPRRP